jgi:outer membrane protein assembly factor BamE (lipoprotein component of BamABCDE complex)
MKKIFSFFALCILLVFLFSNCSVSRALNQPDKKNMNVLAVGTHRDTILAELGNPVTSGIEEDGSIYDIFSFVQGYDKSNKVSRAFIHGILDIASLGLWEVVANPIEGVVSGTKIKIKIVYGKEKKVARVEEIKTPLPPK